MKSWKAFVLLSVLLLSACKDSPNSFGDSFIPAEDRYKFQLASANSSKDSTYYNELKPTSIAYSEAIVIGKLSSGFESSALMRFPFSAPDSIKTMLSDGTIQITNTWVEMVNLYTIGDYLQKFDFTAHRLTSEVDYTAVKSSNFSNITYDAADINAKPKSITDSLTTFWLNTSVVKDWIKVQYDSLNTPKNYGIILKPSSSSEAAMAFLGYETTLGKAVKVFFEFKRETGYQYLDTLSAFATMDTYYAKLNTPAETDKYITLQGSVTYKNKIKFDLPQLPSNAVMNKAYLEFYVDSTKSDIATISKSKYGSTGSLIHVGLITKATGLEIDTASVNYIARQASPHRNKYAGDITSYAQTWINKGFNYGLLISVYGEEYDASRLCLLGTGYPDPALRPKLTITYSIKN